MVKVQIRLLVGLDGQIESVEILNNKIPDLGFREEAVKAIKKMAFKPIIYQGQNIKMYFKKTVIFQY
ncbi:energy transducer TonB [Providencia rettgeri]